MNHRERFLAAIKNKTPDRAVFDLCGSPQTLIDYQKTKDELTELLCVSGDKQGDYDIDERILIALNIDTRLIGGILAPVSKHSRLENDISYNEYGIGFREVNGHSEICYNPLKGCTVSEVNAYELPNAEQIDRAQIEELVKKAEYLHCNTDYIVVAGHPVYGVFELGCWMFGFEDYLYRLAAEPDVVHAFSNRILEYQKHVIEIYYGAIGKYIDCTTSGDDFGTQKAPFMSVEMFNNMIAPYFRERIAYTKKFSNAYYAHHTCGSVYDLLPSLISCGIDILNPIQPGAYKMEPERLKDSFGKNLTFWGGIDTQNLLPNGRPKQIKDEVKRILSVMGKRGGYILSPAHTIQSDVPSENIIAIYEGAMEYYG